ncbi:MAG TPA: Fe-S-containing protein [Candidatus Binataceae bacterium]|nr:Fe-S-containing protein [Candidatus Binataceae bacterium]
MRTSARKFRRRLVLIAVGVLVIAGISLAGIARGPHFELVAGNPLINIDTSNLRPGDARFFAYRDPAGAQLRFLLARDSTGRVQAAFDACRRCYVHRRGFAASNGNLTCRYCGNRYKFEAMSSGLGSCAPVMLPFKMNGRAANIDPADLERERGLF